MKYLIILILIPSIYAIEISEIMYNPEGNDNLKEYIEIQGTNNLSNYIIGDLEQNDSLTLIKFIENSNFSLIVEENSIYNNLNCSIYSAGKTIGNALNNEDTIYLFNNELIDTLSYKTELAKNNNKSLEIINHEFYEGYSPCEANMNPCEIITNKEFFYYQDNIIIQPNKGITYKINNIKTTNYKIKENKKQVITIEAVECNNSKKILVFPTKTSESYINDFSYKKNNNTKIIIVFLTTVIILIIKNDIFN